MKDNQKATTLKAKENLMKNTYFHKTCLLSFKTVSLYLNTFILAYIFNYQRNMKNF